MFIDGCRRCWLRRAATSSASTRATTARGGRWRARPARRNNAADAARVGVRGVGVDQRGVQQHLHLLHRAPALLELRQPGAVLAGRRRIERAGQPATSRGQPVERGRADRPGGLRPSPAPPPGDPAHRHGRRPAGRQACRRRRWGRRPAVACAAGSPRGARRAGRSSGPPALRPRQDPPNRFAPGPRACPGPSRGERHPVCRQRTGPSRPTSR